MVIIEYEPYFLKIVQKIKNNDLKEKVKKQLTKITDNPEIGKTMMHNRKGTREVYSSPFRLSYIYIKEENKIVFLELYHKDEQ